VNAIALALGVCFASLPLASPLPTGKDIFGNAEDNIVEVVATDVSADGTAHRPKNSDGTPASSEYRRMPAALCHNADFTTTKGQIGSCADGEVEGEYQVSCQEGEIALEPIFVQTWTNNPDGTITGLTGWTLLNEGDCLTAVDLAPLAEIEFQSLTITPSPVTVQPPDGWTLVNIETITYTSPTPQTFATTLLGIPVTIEATPTTYTWDYDDGTTPTQTTDPGAPYPAQSVFHTYTDEGTATITLDTTWQGRFQITGTSTWTPITGTARTTATAPPLTIYEARSRLVTDPLD
jgi:hypothetical protein